MVSKSPVGRNGFTQFIGPSQFLSPRISLAFSQLIVTFLQKLAVFFIPHTLKFLIISVFFICSSTVLPSIRFSYSSIQLLISALFSRVGLSTHAEADVPPQLQPISPTVILSLWQKLSCKEEADCTPCP